MSIIYITVLECFLHVLVRYSAAGTDVIWMCRNARETDSVLVTNDSDQMKQLILVSKSVAPRSTAAAEEDKGNAGAVRQAGDHTASS